ncbi:MAG: BlaI/MecI/CopY family transcriptional regulator [Thermoguttaceae bacterium]|jgi:predicted transcriptional regulator
MRKKKNLFDLGRRQRQIVEAVYHLEEASVAEVADKLSDPPSYSAVRAILGILVKRGVLAYRREGKRYLYRAVASKEKTQKSVLKRLLNTLFGGRASVAMAALLDAAGDNLTDADLDEMRKIIDHSRKENR